MPNIHKRHITKSNISKISGWGGVKLVCILPLMAAEERVMGVILLGAPTHTRPGERGTKSLISYTQKYMYIHY